MTLVTLQGGGGPGLLLRLLARLLQLSPQPRHLHRLQQGLQARLQAHPLQVNWTVEDCHRTEWTEDLFSWVECRLNFVQEKFNQRSTLQDKLSGLECVVWQNPCFEVAGSGVSRLRSHTKLPLGGEQRKFSFATFEL